ncbi:hypothetical protein FH972_027340 [Carpinus fangiana]|uniref:Uncharacterized protein n=1 Tax=Carpinus fangiana TaxID=176857 RepID=A0A5N6Q940_9ROSI|nr:hypothetical protein FH972_027340 [Carpinus fangiana]
MEPPAPQAIETSSKNFEFQAEGDVQDKAVNDCCSCCFDCTESCFDYLFCNLC